MEKRIINNYFYSDAMGGSLYRKITDNSHLMWKYKGIACFNADVYNQFKDKIKWIGWINSLGETPVRYFMPIEDFDFHKKELNFMEKQFIVEPLTLWIIK